MPDPVSQDDVVGARRDALGADCVSAGDAIGARHVTNDGEAPRVRPLGLLNPGKVT